MNLSVCVHIYIYGKLGNYLLVVLMANELNGELEYKQFKSINTLAVTNF